MSFVIAAPEALVAVASDLAGIGSALAEANAAALAPTTALLAAGADEVSAAIAALFGAHGQAYQTVSAQASAFHAQFVQALTGGGGAYAAAEAANVSAAQSTDQRLLDLINGPTQALLGRPLIGDGANGGPGLSALDAPCWPARPDTMWRGRRKTSPPASTSCRRDWPTPIRQIRPDLPRRRPAGLRRHPRPSGNSEIGRHALVGIPAAPVQLAVRDGVRGALVKDVRLPQALMPEVVLNCDRDDPGQRGHNVEAIQQALARFAAPADQALLPTFRAFDLPRVRRIDRPR